MAVFISIPKVMRAGEDERATRELKAVLKRVKSAALSLCDLDLEGSIRSLLGVEHAKENRRLLRAALPLAEAGRRRRARDLARSSAQSGSGGPAETAS